MTQKTKTIAGHEITLTVGETYRASRPMAERDTVIYPVTITHLINEGARDVHVIHGCSYDSANELINAFNNDVMSFDGRVW